MTIRLLALLTLAASLAAYVRETYPKFKELLHREPPSDARERSLTLQRVS